ncbi:MAG: acyl-CoA thioester hydrolase YciA [Desulfotalea sp.]
MIEDKTEPAGNLILRTLAMPTDTNPAGDIFGGWIMSQMDIAGGILAKELSCTRVVTVAVEKIIFIRPVKVGDVVCCYGKIVHAGTTSMRISLEVWIKTAIYANCCTDNSRVMVTKADFTYVSVDDNGKKNAINKASPCYRQYLQDNNLEIAPITEQKCCREA